VRQPFLLLSGHVVGHSYRLAVLHLDRVLIRSDRSIDERPSDSMDRIDRHMIVPSGDRMDRIGDSRDPHIQHRLNDDGHVRRRISGLPAYHVLHHTLFPNRCPHAADALRNLFPRQA
jgi:hypothetical protein